MNNFISQLSTLVLLFQQNLHLVLLFIGILWGIQVLNWLVHYRLNIFGIIPRNFFSLPGVFLHPFLHGHFNHLFFNSIPLFVLASFVLFGGLPIFICVSITIIIISGLATWIVGRRGIHVGASGLIMGYWSYLIMSAYHSGSVSVFSIAPMIVCIYYFGGFIFQLFPTEVKTSWEAHLFGFIAGIIAVYSCPEGYCKFSAFLCSTSNWLY